MDCNPVKEKDIVIDIDSCVYTSKELEIPSFSNDKVVSIRVSSQLQMNIDERGGIVNSTTILSNNTNHVGESNPDSVKNAKKEKRKSTSAKKPPRPPRGFSLDAADQKLIKEIAQLAMIKRARNERMKKMKAAKSSSSSSGTLVAMLFTVLVCLVIIFQGCHSGISSRNSAVTKDGNLLLIRDKWNSSMSNAPLTGPGSSDMIEYNPTLESHHDEHKAIG